MLLKQSLLRLQKASCTRTTSACASLLQDRQLTRSYWSNQINQPNNYHNTFYGKSISRSFANKSKKQTQKEKSVKKEEEPVKEQKSTTNKEQQADEKKEQQSQGKKEENSYDYEEDEETQNQFKSYRRFAFIVGKTLKYTSWAAFAIYMYHMYIVTYKEDPEQEKTVEPFFEAAKFTRYLYKDLTILLTRPPVEKLLLDRPPMPQGYQPMKVLVMSLNGTLIHSEYKLGVGFEILKRPGLSMFLQRLARSYELVLFGDQDQGFIHEVAEALDPNMMMLQGRLGRESTLLKGQKYIKDLSYLGRPIKEVVYLDFSDDLVPYHSANTIILPEWNGDMDDRALYDILPFLDSMAQKPGDVRDEIRKYGNTNTAQKFNTVQSQRRDMIMRQRESGVSGLMGKLASTSAQPTPAISGINKLESSDSFGKDWK